MQTRDKTWLDRNWPAVACVMLLLLIIEIIIYLSMGVANAN